MDFATINTARYVAKYNSNGETHTALLRYTSKAAAEAIGPVILTALTSAIISILPNDFGWLDANVYAAGSVISTPTTPPTNGNVAPANALVKADAANKVQFVARSSLGTMYYLNIFGISTNADQVPNGKFRFIKGENAGLDAAVLALNGPEDQVCIDGQKTVFKTYINYRVSGVWQRKLAK